MIADKDWTKSFYGITHKTKNNIQYSITDWEIVAELMVYSWISYQVIEKVFFLRGTFTPNKYQDENCFWNCGEEYISWAKYYVKHNNLDSMILNRKDLSKCNCLDYPQ
jgi:hypothetical protein